MKSKILIAVIGLVVLCFIVINKVNDYVEELNKQIKTKDELIESITKSDSLVDEKTKKYSETITKYINDCNVVINGKEFNFSEFIDIYSKEIQKSNTTRDSLHKYKTLYNQMKKVYGSPYTYRKKNDTTYKLTRNLTKADTAIAYLSTKEFLYETVQKYTDTAYAYKSILDAIEKRTDIKTSFKINNGKIQFELNGFEKIDSALVLLPYYRHRLIKKGATWYTEVDNE